MKKESYTFIDYLAEKAKEEEKYFKNYKFYAKKIKNSAEKLLGKVRVIAFGSILRKDEVPRDIDILIISPKIKSNTDRGKIIAKILKKIGFFSPFEIHLVSPKDYENWYKNFIKDEYIEIK